MCSRQLVVAHTYTDQWHRPRPGGCPWAEWPCRAVGHLAWLTILGLKFVGWCWHRRERVRRDDMRWDQGNESRVVVLGSHCAARLALSASERY